jgi:hypothetical protein
MPEGAQRFDILPENPNDQVGTGGCLCSEDHHPDSGGPFVVFPYTEMGNVTNPHAVLCAPCVLAASRCLREEIADVPAEDEPLDI